MCVARPLRALVHADRPTASAAAASNPATFKQHAYICDANNENLTGQKLRSGLQPMPQQQVEELCSTPTVCGEWAVVRLLRKHAGTYVCCCCCCWAIPCTIQCKLTEVIRFSKASHSAAPRHMKHCRAPQPGSTRLFSTGQHKTTPACLLCGGSCLSATTVWSVFEQYMHHTGLGAEHA